MTFYGTLATGAGWIVPKKYVERVGADGFQKAPVGLGPYRFVSNTPGVELVMEAFEGYWRKPPAVKRLVYKSVPEATTRMAMLKRGEVDLAYLLDVPHGAGDQAGSRRSSSPSRAASAPSISTSSTSGIPSRRGPTGGCAWPPSTPSTARALNEAENLGASRPDRQHRPEDLRVRPALEPYPYDPAKAKQLLAEAATRTASTPATSIRWPPYFSIGEAVVGYLAAVGIKTKMRTMERAAFYSALASKKLRGVCLCINAVYGNAASRLAQIVPADGAYAYGSYPDIEALYQQQGRETDRKKREAMLHQIQRLLYERVRFAPIYEYIWPSGVGPRVAEPALMLIDPYPWSAPLEEVRVKRN